MGTKGKTVLVIEDDKSIAMDIRMLLTAEGYDVVQAENGAVALSMLASAAALPAIMLLDIMMPVMDGWAFRAAQVNDPRLNKIPVVVMTAEGHAGQKAAEMSATAFLQKPFDIDSLLEVLARLA